MRTNTLSRPHRSAAPARGQASTVRVRGPCACESLLPARSPGGDPDAAWKQGPEIALPRNQTLFRAGDAAEALFIVCLGLVKLTHFTRGGEQRVVRLLRPGDALGLECLSGTPCRHTAVALRQSVLCRTPASQIEHMLERGSLAPASLFRLWQATLDRADELLVDLGLGSARSRVARLMLLLSDEAGANCQLFGRNDLGAVLTLTPETVSRVLSDFRQAGAIVQVSLNRYRCDRPALAAIAQGD